MMGGAHLSSPSDPSASPSTTKGAYSSGWLRMYDAAAARRPR